MLDAGEIKVNNNIKAKLLCLQSLELVIETGIK